MNTRASNAIQIARRIDELCCEFEKELGGPDLLEFVDRIPERREQVLFELLAIESNCTPSA